MVQRRLDKERQRRRAEEERRPEYDEDKEEEARYDWLTVKTSGTEEGEAEILNEALGM